MNELRDALPCPFCLSSNLVLGEPTCVECVDCGAKGPDFMKSAYVAVSAWNNRGTDKAKAEYVHTPNAAGQGAAQPYPEPACSPIQSGGGK